MQFQSQLNNLMRAFLKEKDILPCVDTLRFQDGDIILFQHQQDRDLYFIEDGEVRVELKRGSFSSEIRLGRGELIGELSFLLGASRSATIVSVGETICIRFKAKLFEVWLEKKKTQAVLFYRNLGLTLAERLTANTRRSQSQNFFQKGSPLAKKADYQGMVLANRLDEIFLFAQAKNAEIADAIREEMRQYQSKKGKEEFNKHDFSLEVETTEELFIHQNEEQLEEIREELSKGALDVFEQLCTLLNRFWDQGQRQRIAQSIRPYFDHVLQQTKVYRELKDAQYTESPNLMAEVLTKPNRADSLPEILNRVVLDLPTPNAYREMFQWLQKEIRALDFNQLHQLSVVNDMTGSMFALLYPLMASQRGVLHFYSDNLHSFGCVNVGLQHYGKSSYRFQRIKSWEDFSTQGTFEEKQDLFVIVSLLDYLADDLALGLLRKVSEALQPEGVLLLIALSTTIDSAFFCEFLGWSTIRRKKERLNSLLKEANFGRISIQEDKGALMCTAKK
ncbi:MAG: cyclic nucleotide-binding domain-containing protein [Myxococcota bacterium]|nr:cyclic nucleotide-binding domain-containing protein [Myxococcota bacterium]